MMKKSRITAIFVAVLMAFAMMPVTASTVHAGSIDYEYLDVSTLPESEQIVSGAYYMFTANISNNTNLNDQANRILGASVDTSKLPPVASSLPVVSTFDSNVLWRDTSPQNDEWVFQINEVDSKDGDNQGYTIYNVIFSRYVDVLQKLQQYPYARNGSPMYITGQSVVADIEPTFPYVALTDNARVWYWDKTNKEFYTFFTSPGWDAFGTLHEIDYTNGYMIRTVNNRWFTDGFTRVLWRDYYAYNDLSDMAGCEEAGSAHQWQVYGRNSKFALKGIHASINRMYSNGGAVLADALRDPVYAYNAYNGTSVEDNYEGTATLGVYHRPKAGQFCSMDDVFSTYNNPIKAEMADLKLYRMIPNTVQVTSNDEYNQNYYLSTNYGDTFNVKNIINKISLSNQHPLLGWSYSESGPVLTGADAEFVFKGPKTLYAQWLYEVTVKSNDNSLGSVEITNIQRPGEDYGIGYLQNGTKVTAKAAPSQYVVFNGWKVDDEIVSTDLTYEFTVTGDEVVTAEFVPFTGTLEDLGVVVKGSKFTYNGKVQKPQFETSRGWPFIEGTHYSAEWSNASSTKAGTYSVTLMGLGNITGTTEVTYTINKAANPLKMTARTAIVKYSKLKKKTQTLAVTKVIKFTKKLNDKKTYTLSSAKKGSKSFKKYFKINKTTGKVTVKKGLKKGTYKVKVKVKALGNNNYKASKVKTVTFTVKVK